VSFGPAERRVIQLTLFQPHSGLSFRARCYTTAKEDPAKAGAWLYTKQVDYTPIGLEAEKDTAFLSRLDMLKDPFTFTRDQTYAFMANLQEKMTAEEDAED
jgi:hypothetical protein